MLGVQRIAERVTARSIDPGRLPRHIGIIPDGNRTWARKRARAIADGYRDGFRRIFEVFEWCDEFGVEVVTLFTLADGNLNRPPSEVAGLLAHTRHLVRELAGYGWRIRLLGSPDLLPGGIGAPPEPAAPPEQAEPAAGAPRPRPPAGSRMTVNLAVGYNGRQEIVRAVQAFLLAPAVRRQSAARAAELLTVHTLGEQFATHGQPDPDLVIRTSGEQRLSGFLTWQSDQSELYFCSRCWPDFRRIDFLRALRSYTGRDRRFGR